MSDPRLPRREFIATGVRGNYILGEAIAAGAGRINVVGVCGVWKVAREKMAADLADKHGMKPRPFARHQGLLELPGLDAVIITTPDHAHCAVLTDVVHAGKDAFATEHTEKFSGLCRVSRCRFG